MPGFFKSMEDHQARYENWKSRIDNVNELDIPESFARNMSPEEKEGTYNRLNGYVKQWLLGIMQGDDSKWNDMHKSEIGDFHIYDEDLPDNWYELAISAASRKKVAGLPVIGSSEDKVSHSLHTKVMPAYRALKERFDKRPFWHWFTQHAEYTAERDALKAIKGLTRVATGMAPKAFDAMYANYESRMSRATSEEFADDFKKDGFLYGKENNQTDFYEKMEERLNNPSFMRQVAKDIANNLPSTNREDKERKLNAVELSMRNIRKNMLKGLDKYDRGSKNEANKTMMEIASVAWNDALDIVKMYNPRRTNRISSEDITERQLIADAIMKNLSPIAFDSNLEKYADGYVLKNQAYFPLALQGYRGVASEALAAYEKVKANMNEAVSNNEGELGLKNVGTNRNTEQSKEQVVFQSGTFAEPSSQTSPQVESINPLDKQRSKE